MPQGWRLSHLSATRLTFSKQWGQKARGAALCLQASERLASLEASADLTDKVGILPKSRQFTTQFYFTIWALQSEKSRVKSLRNNSPRGQQDGLDSKGPKANNLSSTPWIHVVGENNSPKLSSDLHLYAVTNTPSLLKKKLKISPAGIRQQLWESL